MTIFESLVLLLAVAIPLLQVARRFHVPYPTMLAGSGVVLALLPGAPTIGIDPHLALALFIAPALSEAGFDFPLAEMRRYWRQLVVLVVFAVILTAAAVAWVGVALGGLPLYAALALGAIVAPPDAAAATAVLRNVRMPRRSVTVLKGESLLNDSTALLLFVAAVSFHERAQDGGALALQLAVAGPGGVLLGIAIAGGLRRVLPHLRGTLGGNLVEFVATFGTWLIAERLHLSAVLAVVAFSMSAARRDNLETPPQVRIHSFAVWDTAVFLLNVLAFLLMGLQARAIVARMPTSRLLEAGTFAMAVAQR